MTEDLQLAVLTDEELDAVSGGIANVAANNLVNVQANVSNVLNNNDVAAAVGVLSSGVGAFAPR
jgi:bacteriocin-like protein